MIISFPDVARIRCEKERAAGRVEGSTTRTAARGAARRDTTDRRRSRQDELEDVRARETARRARHAMVGAAGASPDHRRMPPDQAARLVEDIRRRVDRRPELVSAVAAYLSPTAGDRL